MASNSFAPMRRFKISSRPVLASKYHFPLRFRSRMGNGKSSLPADTVARFGFFGSMLVEFFSFALATNAPALSLSPTGSPEVIRSVLSGPRISFRAETSKVSAAAMRLSTPCLGVSNAFCCGCAVAPASDLLSDAAYRLTATKKELRIAHLRILDEIMMFNFGFIALSFPIFGGLRGESPRHGSDRRENRGTPCYGVP